MLRSLFPHIRTTELTTGTFNTLSVGVDRAVYVVLALGYSPYDIQELFGLQNVTPPAGKLHVHTHEYVATISNHYNQPMEVEQFMLVAKDDIPARFNGTTGLSVSTLIQALVGLENLPPSPFNTGVFNQIGFKPYNCTALLNYFTVRRMGRHRLLPGASYTNRRVDRKSYAFSVAKYYASAASYCAYKGNKFIFNVITGVPSIPVTDVSRQECSYGGCEGSFTVRENYDVAMMPFPNNQVGFHRLGNPSTTTIANTVTWAPALNSIIAPALAAGIN